MQKMEKYVYFDLPRTLFVLSFSDFCQDGIMFKTVLWYNNPI